MLTSLNLIYVVNVAVVSAANCDWVCDGVDASVCERVWKFSQLIVVAIQIDLS